MSASPDLFSEFWASYPRRTGKGAARGIWLIRTRETPPEQIISALRAQLDAGQFSDDIQFIPHPRTWLHQQRYEDDIIPRRRPVFRNPALELLAREFADGDGDDQLQIGGN